LINVTVDGNFASASSSGDVLPGGGGIGALGGTLNVVNSRITANNAQRHLWRRDFDRFRRVDDDRQLSFDSSSSSGGGIALLTTARLASKTQPSVITE
jgi:hypothetical protein